MKIERLTLSRRSKCRLVSVVFLFYAATIIGQSTPTFNVITSFDGPNGGNPNGPLFQAIDGNFYGTTFLGGTTDNGTVFRVTSAGELSTLYSFCSQPQCTDGGKPSTGIVQATNGLFYGTTTIGGQAFGGIAFGMTSAGNLGSLYDFGVEQIPSTAALIQSHDGGDLFGLTASTAFKMSPKGTLTTIYNFSSDGLIPSGLMYAPDGNFYMTTHYGGTNDYGAIYKMTPDGQVSTLYSFCQINCTIDGQYPEGDMVLGTDGSLYGTTIEGGMNGAGTVFKITRAGIFITLHNFCSQTKCADGNQPSGLVRGTDGNFYGVTFYGGNRSIDFPFGAGTLYAMTSNGGLRTLYRFCSQKNCLDGAGPFAGLIQSTDGNFYGTTVYGGSNASGCPQTVDGPCGTAFRLSTGLGPFVKLTQDSGKVGQTGGILGQGFTGTTGVFINGTPASFIVVSDTFIEATVPGGASSGYVTVNTPSGTLTSNVVFRVKH